MNEFFWREKFALKSFSVLLFDGKKVLKSIQSLEKKVEKWEKEFVVVWVGFLLFQEFLCINFASVRVLWVFVKRFEREEKRKIVEKSNNCIIAEAELFHWFDSTHRINVKCSPPRKSGKEYWKRVVATQIK